MRARYLLLFLAAILFIGCRRPQPPAVQVEEPASLLVDVESANVRLESGLSAKVKVRLTRKNLADAIQVELLGLPPGLSATPVSLSANETTAEVELSAAPGTTLGEKNRIHAVASAGAVQAKSAIFSVTVTKPVFTCVFEPTSIKIPKGETRQIKVIVQRAKEAYQGPIAISLANLPKNVTAVAKGVGPEGTDWASFTIQTPAAGLEGETQAHVRIEGGRQLRGVALLPIIVQGAPFVLKAEPTRVAGVYGQSTKVKISAARKDYQGPIVVKLENLPAHVKAKPFTLPAKETTGELDLLVSGDALSLEKTVQVRGSTDDSRNATAAFTLNIEGKPFGLQIASRLEVVQGDTAKLKVSAVRTKDYIGSIALEVRNLPENCKASSLGIQIKEKDGEIDIKAEDVAKLGSTPGIQIVGIAQVGVEKREVRFDNLTLVVVPQFTLQVQPGKVELQEGQKATVKVNAARRTYKGAIDVELKNLPAGVTAAAARIASNQDSVEVELAAGAGSGGRIKPDVQALGTFTNKKQIASSNFTVEVISKLFELKVDKIAKVAMGGKAAFKVTAQRLEYQGPISLEVKNLPVDIKAQKVILPAGQNEIDIEIAATDQAKETKTDVHILGTAMARDNQQRASGNFVVQILPGVFGLKIEPSVLQMHHGGTAKLIVTAQRMGHDGPISVELKNLPTNISADKILIPKGENRVEIEVKAQLTVLDGAKVDVFAQTVIASKKVDSARVTVNVASVGQPVRLELKIVPTAIKLVVGGTTKVKVAAMRNGYTGAIAVDLRNLPAEVESSKGMIAEGENEIEITLTARTKTEPITKLDVCAVGIAMGDNNRPYASPQVALHVGRK